MLNSPAELLRIVNASIEKVAADNQPNSLYEPIRYVLSLGGKRVRPVLMLLAYSMFKDNPSEIIDVAIGLETYHNFTLLHDDLMDNAAMRRGRTTVHRRWNANTAILSGDNMLVMAYQYIGKAPKERLPEVLDVFTRTAIQIDEGQQLDMDFEQRNDVSEAEYLEMIRLKTSVLLACALKIGAILGEASADTAAQLYRFGELVGLAFQLQDDYLDVFGDPLVFGKAIGGDIVENKKTFMLIKAMECANATQRQQLDAWLQTTQSDTAEKIANITRLYTEIGVDKQAQDRIKAYFDEAERVLDALPLPEERKRNLRCYVRQMMGRNA